MTYIHINTHIYFSDHRYLTCDLYRENIIFKYLTAHIMREIIISIDYLMSLTEKYIFNIFISDSQN